MGLFKRKGSDNSSEEDKKEKGAWKRPANTAFKQQRLKAWQPILTPKTVLPTFFIIAIIFGPIGGLLIWGSSLVTEMVFDYTNCDSLSPQFANSSLLTYHPLSSSQYSYFLSASASKNAAPITPPAYAFINNTGNSDFDVFNQLQCYIQFDVPADLPASVFLYYKLTNFFQNHRRYVKSMDSNQLSGKGGSASSLNNGDCNPLASINNSAIYPCGLIANSVFNDTFDNLTLLNPANFDTTNVTYNFTDQNIAWPGEAKKYVSSPIGNGYNSVSEIVPPPNWQLQYPNGYNSSNLPNLATDYRFQNWMRTAGLPTFSKLYGRNDTTTMQAGRYRIIVGLNFPVKPYKGTKSIVISTVSWIGGKNPFLGWAYVAAAALFVFFAVAGTARHLIKPRRLGDMSLLSWNR